MFKEAFDSNIVNAFAFAVHGDGYTVFLEKSGIGFVGVLTALIGVEYLHGPVFGDRLFWDPVY